MDKEGQINGLYGTVQDITERKHSEKVDKMSVKDSLFVLYLKKHINDSMAFTIQEKCTRLIGSAIINAKFEQLNKEREKAFVFYFKKREVEKQIKIYKAI